MGSSSDSFCFQPSELASPTFDVDGFLQRCREENTLTSLHVDLNRFSKALREELVALINKEYSDFISLSSKLNCLDGVMENFRTPLKHMYEQIRDFDLEIQHTLEEIERKQSRREQLRQQRAVLEAWIDIDEATSKMEGLLASATEEQVLASVPATRAPLDSVLEEDMLLERVSREIARVKVRLHAASGLASQVGGMSESFEELQARVGEIDHSLDRRLETNFQQCLKRLLKSQDEAQIAEHLGQKLLHLLRAYAASNKTLEAEDFLRRAFIAPSLERRIEELQASFISSAAPSSSSSSIALLEQFAIFVLNLVQQKYAMLLDLTLPHPTTVATDATAVTGAPFVLGFDFLGRSIWPAVYEVLCSKLSNCFLPGIPDSFHSNYSISMHLLSVFETRYSCREGVLHFRHTPAYSEFIKKWNINIYFQLRFQEIASDAEHHLAESFNSQLTVASMDGAVCVKPHSSGFLVRSTESILKNCLKCFHDHIFLSALSPRFLRLSMQLLSRFCSWVRQMHSTHNSDDIKNPEEVARIMTVLAVDVEALAFKVGDDVYKLALSRIKAEEAQEHIRSCLSAADTQLRQLVNPCFELVIKAICAACNTQIGAVKTLVTVYRMTGRPAPTKPSSFVSLFLKSLKSYLHDHAPYLTETRRISIRNSVVESVNAQLLESVNTMTQEVKKMEEMLRRLKKAAPTAGEMSDADKIMSQLYLDIKEYGNELHVLGHSTQTDSVYTQLAAQLADYNMAA